MINAGNLNELTYYWSETARKDKLYIAIRANNTAEIERLRAEGVGLSEHIKSMLEKGGGSLVNPNEYGMDWYDFSYGLSNYSPEEFISVIRNLYAELGEPIYYSDTVGSNVREFYRTDVFKCLLECFDNKKISKKWTLHGIIDRGNTELLEFVAERGWLRLSKQLDELIEYSQQKGKTECTAFLIEYKNQKFDLAKEREKAEKKAERELNAAPDSVTVLKQLWNYKKREDETLVITKYKGTQTEIVIPEKIGKNIVTAIEVDTYDWGSPKKGFVNQDIQNTITKITLPKGIVSIGSGIFYQFTGLREINIPDGVTSIGMQTFFGCENLKRLKLPDSVKEIGSEAFFACWQLEEINIPLGVTEIFSSVFESCNKLKTVDIPDSVKCIGHQAFGYCDSLEFISIPSGVSKIQEYTFCECRNLTRVELPNSIEKIDRSAFLRCLALKEIVIPEGVREIGETAFAECTALEKIVLPGSLQKIKNYTQKGIEPRTIFYNSPNVTAVVTPKSYAERYCKRNNIPFVYKDN